ncbi:lambda-exonuclease family protein [Carnobacterium divergens]|uniref:lambda-exonuclease family protein n=1 Tax=Carnobacterium divergens TaxID=2748 RepID=UPI0028917F0F|nr:YqaJ viral recombinase family protein [Carnobacterium divergens]MDT2011211.1 YqaJ viral recombinase family protein [Carnobacterium divergens]
MSNLFGVEKVDPNVTENRNVYVGGSDVPVILGLSKYKTQYELAKEKAEIVKSDFQSNPYINYGNKMEPMIREYINTVNSLHFRPETFVDEENWIRSNVDGYDEDTGLLLEIKTHGASPTIKVYEAQMQLYMKQMNIDVGWLAMYKRPGDFDLEFDRENLQIKEIERDDDYIQKILDSIETFWIRVQALKDNPEMNENEFYTYGNDVDKLVANVQRFEIQMLELNKKIEKLKYKQKEYRELLYQKMEKDDIKKIDTGEIIVTRMLPTTRKSIDSTKLKKEKPEVYEAYVKESSVKGSIRIKESSGVVN